MAPTLPRTAGSGGPLVCQLISGLLNNSACEVFRSEFSGYRRVVWEYFGCSMSRAGADAKLRVMLWPSCFAIGTGCRQPR
jgi:hypothetical protein